MSGRRRLDADVEALVRRRANGLCECCHADERWRYVRFTVGHVRPVSTGGADDPSNLALACFHCNRYKSDRSTDTDPDTLEEASLFDPRQSEWARHFAWSSDRMRVVGMTATGRATVVALQMNRARAVQIREADLAVGRQPPDGDPFLKG